MSKPEAFRTGLGLPLTKRLVEAHGATFSLASEIGDGTIATIEFSPKRLIEVWSHRTP